MHRIGGGLQRCGNCRFFWRSEGAGYDSCRLRPPQVNGGQFGHTPRVTEKMWCGQWRPEGDDYLNVVADYLEKEGCPKKWLKVLRAFETWH